MRSSVDGTISAFATFNVVGSALVPQEITDALEFFPTTAYANGETYYGGPRSNGVRGRTGVWFFSTDKVISSKKLDDHTIFLVNMLTPEITLPMFVAFGFAIGRLSSQVKLHKLEKLVSIMKTRDLSASMTLFWHGVAGAKHPVVSRRLVENLSMMRVAVTMDFATDEQPTGNVPSKVVA